MLTQGIDSEFKEMEERFVLQLENSMDSGNYEGVLICHLRALCDDHSWETESVFWDFFNGHIKALREVA